MRKHEACGGKSQDAGLLMFEEISEKTSQRPVSFNNFGNSSGHDISQQPVVPGVCTAVHGITEYLATVRYLVL